MRIVFENVPKHPETSFACVRFAGKFFECPYHNHPEIELLLIESSAGRRVIGDAPGRFQAGQVYLLGPDLPHLFQNDRTPGAKKKPRDGAKRTMTATSAGAACASGATAGATEAARSVCVQFLPECLGKGFWDLPETRRIGRLLKRAERGLAWDATRGRGVTPLIVEIFQAKGASRMAKLLETLEALSTLGGAQVLASESCQTAGSTVVSGRINRVLEYLHANLSGRVETGVAARRSGLSKSGFARFFRRYMGRSFNDYVIGQRLAEARRLLAGTDRTVAQICFDCGFENLSNFNRLFRARTNATPSAYRRRVNGSTAVDR